MSWLSEARGRVSVLRARFPKAAFQAESARIGLRGYPRLVAEVQRMRIRMHELERDHALLAAHVATLTERAFAGRESADSPALERARLSAIASYEHRIAALEQQAGSTRHARAGRPTAAASRTSDERQGSAS